MWGISMKTHYLIKRVLAFLTDVIIYYLMGVIIYIALGNKSLPLGMDRIAWTLITLSFVVIFMGVYYSLKGASIGQEIFKLRSQYYCTKYGKFLRALIKSYILFLFIVPVVFPPILLLVLALTFILSSIGTYKKHRRLFIDVVTGIDVVEYEKE